MSPTPPGDLGLRSDEGHWRQLLESLPQLVWTCRPDGHCDFLSQRWLDFTGVAEGPQLGSGWIAQVHPDDREGLLAQWQTSVDTGTDLTVEFRIRRHDGVYRWFDTRAVGVRDGDGRVIRWLGTNTDVDDAVALRVAVAAERRRFEQISELAPGAIVSIRQRPDGSAEFLYASKGFEDLYGLRSDEVALSARPAADRVHPDDQERLRDSIATAARTGSVWHDEYRVVHPSGRVRWVEATTAPLPEPDGSTVWHGFMQDVTERIRWEQQLRSAEVRLRSALRAGRMGTYFRDLLTGEERLDDVLLSLWGRTRDEVSTIDDAMSFVHPADRRHLEQVERALMGGASVPPIEFRVVQPDGAHAWLASHGSVETDASGSPTVLAGIVIDVSAQKRAAESHLRSQRLQALGTLASSVAHDFNNVLQAIVGNVGLAEADLEPDHPASEALADIGRATDRAVALVNQILSFSRPYSPPAHPIDLAGVVDEAVGLLRAVLPKTLAITTHAAPGARPVRVESSRVHQIVTNLVTNAAQAIGDRPGSIELRIDGVTAPVDDPGARALEPGPHTCLTVADDGPGMDAPVASRAFDPFFTTRDAEMGIGLGLAIVYSVVTSCRGALSLETQPGVGTTLRLYFPAVDEDVSPEADDAARPAPVGGGQRVLFVDDEEVLVRLGERMLRRLGYGAATFTDPRAALRAFASAPDAFDAVVTDLTMPGMSGAELARSVLEIRPELPVVVLSGFVDAHREQHARELGVRDLILKPATIDVLGETLGAIFD